MLLGDHAGRDMVETAYLKPYRKWTTLSALDRRIIVSGGLIGMKCMCGQFVPFVEEEGEDVCEWCGRRYRIRIQTKGPGWAIRG